MIPEGGMGTSVPTCASLCRSRVSMYIGRDVCLCIGLRGVCICGKTVSVCMIVYHLGHPCVAEGS